MNDTATASFLTDWPEFAEIGMEGLEQRALTALAEQHGDGFEVIHREIEPISTVKINGTPCEIVGPDILRVKVTMTRN